MKCPVCSTELPNDAKFCAKCGSRVAPAANTAAAEDTTATAAAPNASANSASPARNAASAHGGTFPPSNPAPVNAATAPTAKPAAKFPNRKPLVIGGIAAMLVIIAIAVGLLAFGGSDVPESTVRDTVASSSIVSNGLVPSQYVNESAYELTDFSVDSQADFDIGALGEAVGIEEAKTVTFSGIVKNANFESTFTGTATFGKQGNSWISLDSPQVSSSNTTPLKGVDTLGDNSADETAAYSNFSSTFEQTGDGAWASSASVTVTYSFWFATDTAHNTRSFTFDQQNGWTPNGEIQASDMQTAWLLAGKSFTLQPKSTLSTSYDTSSTLTISSAEGEQATGAYSLAATYTGSNQYNLNVNLEGSLAGTLRHQFGENQFEMVLNDQENSATFSLKGGSSTQTVAGSGEVNTLSGQLTTNTLYFDSPFMESEYSPAVTYAEAA